MKQKQPRPTCAEMSERRRRKWQLRKFEYTKKNSKFTQPARQRLAMKRQQLDAKKLVANLDPSNPFYQQKKDEIISMSYERFSSRRRVDKPIEIKVQLEPGSIGKYVSAALAVFPPGAKLYKEATGIEIKVKEETYDKVSILPEEQDIKFLCFIIEQLIKHRRHGNLTIIF